MLYCYILISLVFIVECHAHVQEMNKSVCPSCRVKLSRERPSRNRLAESIVANMAVTCELPGCDMKMTFGELAAHMGKTCQFRDTTCKFHPLGCDWQGLEKDRRSHEKVCELRKASVKKILQLVNARNLAREEKESKALVLSRSQAAVCDQLSARCRDMVWRDVIIEQDQYTNIICSKPFHALGLAWEAHLALQDADQKTKGCYLSLQCVSSMRQKLVLKICVLKGPGLGMDLTPSIFKRVFRRKRKKSEPFTLPLSPEVSQVFENQQMCLRIGFVDCSPGPLYSGFTSSNVIVDSDDSDQDQFGESGPEDSGHEHDHEFDHSSDVFEFDDIDSDSHSPGHSGVTPHY